MNRRLTIVFLALIATTCFGRAAAQGPLVLDPAKLRLASLNAVIVDASAQRSVYAKGADEVTPIASLTKLMTDLREELKPEIYPERMNAIVLSPADGRSEPPKP